MKRSRGPHNSAGEAKPTRATHSPEASTATQRIVSPTIRWRSQWCSSSSASNRAQPPAPIGVTLSPANQASRTHQT